MILKNWGMETEELYMNCNRKIFEKLGQVMSTVHTFVL